MTTISNNTIEDTNDTSYVSPDELMLKELERRDGIYSFIFHELEKSAPSDDKLAATVLENSASTTTNTVTTTNASSCSTTQSTLIPTVVPRIPLVMPTLKKKQEYSDMPFLSSKIKSLSHIEERLQSTSSQHDFKKPLPSLVPFRTAFFGNNFTKRQFRILDNNATSTCANTFTSTPTATLTSTCSKNNNNTNPINNTYGLSAYQNVFRENPNPKLYSYMSNCTVRVRLAPPRFSHVSVPLVRNRRHSLKELPEYTNSYSSHSNVPDLRELFPNDPDVHIPFITPTSPYDDITPTNSTIITTSDSPEITKYERLSPDIQLEDIQLTDDDNEEEVFN